MHIPPHHIMAIAQRGKEIQKLLLQNDLTSPNLPSDLLHLARLKNYITVT
jgi:hypothetical protein